MPIDKHEKGTIKFIMFEFNAFRKKMFPLVFFSIPLGVFLCSSCAFQRTTTAVIWTDHPEFAIYGEYFNSSQEQYKVETRYFPSPAQKLTQPGEFPDIVVGNWLKSASTRTLFKPLDALFKNGVISGTAFYPRLLALGNIEGRQYLLPVSFNLPALVFAEENSSLLSNPFTVSLEEIKQLGKDYNQEGSGGYSRMGFSPAWNDEFLFITATLFSTSFREGSPLAWDPMALERAMNFVSDWIKEANTDIRAEDDFAFKYFYDPPIKLVLSGRILFTYMGSAEFFTSAEERRTRLDFRWIAERNTIPLSEETLYYGIYKNGKAGKASEAFTRWFFQAETQRLLLETSKKMRINETLFGIGNGFSAMRTVTEQIFPQFYPNLLGHMPPEDFLSPPNILPRRWMTIKERVILPYMRDRIRYTSPEEIRYLDKRLTEWYRINREM
jgi:ABC-type glycerol-3-phosphate transport system substrate-binding protein